MRSFKSCTHIKYYLGDQIKQNEMGRACSPYCRAEEIYRFRWGNLKEGDRLDDLCIDRRILSK
jgi:hypothetical protein